MSDLHLFESNWRSFTNNWLRPTGVKYLIVLGNVMTGNSHGQIDLFFQELCKPSIGYEKIFYVLGNNEFRDRFRPTMEDTIEWALQIPTKIEQVNKLIVLDDARYHLVDRDGDVTNHITILGCTLCPFVPILKSQNIQVAEMK